MPYGLWDWSLGVHVQVLSILFAGRNYSPPFSVCNVCWYIYLPPCDVSVHAHSLRITDETYLYASPALNKFAGVVQAEQQILRTKVFLNIYPSISNYTSFSQLFFLANSLFMLSNLYCHIFWTLTFQLFIIHHSISYAFIMEQNPFQIIDNNHATIFVKRVIQTLNEL